MACCSFDRDDGDVVEQATYEERVCSYLRRGRSDIDEGRFVEGVDALFNAVHEKVMARGQIAGQVDEEDAAPRCIRTDW